MRRLLYLLIVVGHHLTCSAAEESSNSCEVSPLKILHLTFHKGCLNEFENIASKLGLDLESWFIPDLPAYFLDGVSAGNALYNIGHERANNIWELHHNYFETFDVILVSDTAPLSRIFTQNPWNKPLVIWICNRFDYFDQASLDCDFPDREYYQLFEEACHCKNIKVIGYTAFEHYYAKTKNIDTGSVTITPCGHLPGKQGDTIIPSEVVKEEAFFLPPYHNETKFMDLSQFLARLDIKNYCGRYNGPMDIKDFKGIIHLPYSWSNLALFENIHLSIPYFIPTEEFLEKLAAQKNYFHPNLNALINDKLYYLSEWYCSEHREIITYFDSWEDLRKKLEETDFVGLKKRISIFSKELEERTLSKWNAVFTELGLTID